MKSPRYWVFMKFICNAAELSDAITKVIKAIPARAVAPVYECVKIAAGREIIMLTATDGSFCIEKMISAKIISDGEALVKGKFFSEFIKRIGDSELTAELSSDNALVLTYRDGETKINCLLGQSFPPSRDVDYNKTLKLKQAELKKLINLVIFAAPNEDNEGARSSIKGCLLEITKNTLRLVALDGYRLALAEKPLEQEEKEAKLIVPANVMKELANLLSDDDSSIILRAATNKLELDMAHTIVTTALYTDDYVDYNRIIASDDSTVITVSRKQLFESMERAAVLSREEKTPQVIFEIKEGILSVKSAGNIGDVNEKLPVSLNGKDLSIAFNSKFITDCLKAVDDEYLKFRFTSSTVPAIIQSVDNTKEYLFLVIPIRMY